MELIQINQQTCNQCGACAAVCPAALFDFQVKDYPRPVASAERVCLRCGHCVAVCPTASVNHRDMPVKDCTPLQKSLLVSAEQCEQQLRSRRSIRAYQNKAVPRDVITRLIEIARYAPTGHNAQELEWLVLDNPEELKRVEKLGTGWIEWIIKNQPQMAAAFDMKKMLERQEKHNNTFLRDAPVLLVTHAAKNSPLATIDSAIALTFLDLAAASQGLGTCWAGFVQVMANTFPPVIEALALPQGYTACGAMMLGYPEFRYQRLPSRRPPRITWR